MKIFCVFFVLIFIGLNGFSQTDKNIHGPTDTLMLNEFRGLIGTPTTLSYGYTNGSGYFFGTNFIDIDQNPATPYENGVQAFGQGFPIDTGQSYYILDILVRIGVKTKSQNSTGTPLILSVQYLDDSSTYNVNTSSGTTSYTIHAPGTSLGSASILWADMLTGVGVKYSIAHFNTPILVDKNFVVVIDLMDFYLNGDKIGLYASPNNGATGIYGQEYTLWLYPNPMLWLQVNHIFSSLNRAIAIFPVVDDGSFGIEHDKFLNGIKLGQSFPNPAINIANFEFEIQSPTTVKVEFTDVNGKTVLVKDLGKLTAGQHSFSTDVSQWTLGNYFYTLQTETQSLTKKLVISR